MENKSLEQIIESRLEKLKKIRDLGINPYPYEFKCSHATIILPSYFSSSMVLQQNENVNFWGISTLFQHHITVTFDNKSFETTSDKNGKFQVQLPGQKASLKQYTISTKSIIGTPSTTLIVTSSVDSPHSPIIPH